MLNQDTFISEEKKIVVAPFWPQLYILN